MLLNGDDSLGLGSGPYDGFLVERLHAVHVEDLGGNALRGKELGGLLGRIDHLAAGDDGNVSALGHDSGLVHFEGAAILGVNVLDRIAADADVSALVVLEESLDQLGGLETIAGQIYAHVGDGAHGGDILGRVVAHAEGAVADAAGNADELDVGPGVGHVDLALLIASGGKEAGRGSRERLFAGGSKSCGNADQVLLSDADLDRLLRESREERSQGGGASGVGAEDDDVLVRLGLLHQYVTDSFAIGYLIHLKQPPSVP